MPVNYHKCPKCGRVGFYQPKSQKGKSKGHRLCRYCGYKESFHYKHPNPKLKYKTIDTRTVKGLRQAERLKAKGWKVASVGFHTIMLYKK